MNTINIFYSIVNYLSFITFASYLNNYNSAFYLFLFFMYIQFEIIISKNPTLYLVRGFPACGRVELHTTIRNTHYLLNCDKKNYIKSLIQIVSKDFYFIQRPDVFAFGVFATRKSYEQIESYAEQYNYDIKYYSFEKPLTLYHMYHLLDQRKYPNKIDKGYYSTKYELWEDDDRFAMLENNYKNTIGDSLKYPIVTKEKLDAELDDIVNNITRLDIKLCALCDKRTVTHLEYICNKCYCDNVDSSDEERASDYDSDSDEEERKSDEDYDPDDDIYTDAELSEEEEEFSEEEDELREEEDVEEEEEEKLSEQESPDKDALNNDKTKFVLKMTDGKVLTQTKNCFRMVDDDKFCVIEEDTKEES